MQEQDIVQIAVERFTLRGEKFETYSVLVALGEGPNAGKLTELTAKARGVAGKLILMRAWPSAAKAKPAGEGWRRDCGCLRSHTYHQREFVKLTLAEWQDLIA